MTNLAQTTTTGILSNLSNRAYQLATMATNVVSSATNYLASYATWDKTRIEHTVQNVKLCVNSIALYTGGAAAYIAGNSILGLVQLKSDIVSGATISAQTIKDHLPNICKFVKDHLPDICKLLTIASHCLKIAKDNSLYCGDLTRKLLIQSVHIICDYMIVIPYYAIKSGAIQEAIGTTVKSFKDQYNKIILTADPKLLNEANKEKSN